MIAAPTTSANLLHMRRIMLGSAKHARWRTVGGAAGEPAMSPRPANHRAKIRATARALTRHPHAAAAVARAPTPSRALVKLTAVLVLRVRKVISRFPPASRSNFFFVLPPQLYDRLRKLGQLARLVSVHSHLHASALDIRRG